MNTTLKSLVLTGFDFADELCPALRDGLGKNSTLERLGLKYVKLAAAGVTALSFYFKVIKAVQSNTTLKTLYFCDQSPQMTDDEVTDITSLVKQNYRLESLPGIEYGERMGDLRTILRLNTAGRRYLHEDGSSIVKGADVLGAVSHDLDSVFLHLLENPTTFFVGGGK
jgi:hypothetical protein